MKQYGIQGPFPGDEVIEFKTKLAAYDAQLPDDKLMFRETVTITYRGEEYEVLGPWVPAHCEFCKEAGDLAPCWGVDENKLTCSDCWGEIHEAVEAEIKWQRRHETAA